MIWSSTKKTSISQCPKRARLLSVWIFPWMALLDLWYKYSTACFFALPYWDRLQLEKELLCGSKNLQVGHVQRYFSSINCSMRKQRRNDDVFIKLGEPLCYAATGVGVQDYERIDAAAWVSWIWAGGFFLANMTQVRWSPIYEVSSNHRAIQDQRLLSCCELQYTQHKACSEKLS